MSDVVEKIMMNQLDLKVTRALEQTFNHIWLHQKLLLE